MNYVQLKDVCVINMGQSPDSNSYNDNEEGLPFFQGNADFGEMYPVTRKWCSSPTKIASEGDILISVRAPIGALNYAKEPCCIGRGLAALTPNKSKVSPAFIFWLLKSKNEELNSNGTGSTFKAIGRKVLEETLIPNISLDEQIVCVKALEKIYYIMQTYQQQLQKLDELVKARFVELFGDPVSNSMGWSMKRLAELGELNRGISKARPRNLPELLGGPYPLIQTGDVSNADAYITSFSSTYSEKGLAQSRLWPKGTLCITIAANIAQTSILTFDACFPDSVVGFISADETNELFIHYWFSFFQKILDEQAPQVAQKNINLKILSELAVITPPLCLQNQFSAFVKKVDKSKVVALNRYLYKPRLKYQNVILFLGDEFVC